jgi:outer membrane protein assembly factor BamA
MRHRGFFTQIAAALLLATCAVLSAQAQRAPTPPPDAKDPVYHLLGFSLRGTKRVDTAALVASLPQHEGDVITRAQIMENADKIRAVLKARHVHGDMTTGLLEREGPGHHIWVMWDIQPMDALSYAPMPRKRFFVSQSFAGNTKLTNDALAAATGLHPGDKMPDGSLGDARTGIEQAYDPVLHGATVGVKGKVKVKPDYGVIIEWQIVEPK